MSQVLLRPEHAKRGFRDEVSRFEFRGCYRNTDNSVRTTIDNTEAVNPTPVTDALG